MRVVHVLRKYNPEEWGGTETALQRLLEGMRGQNVSSVVYSPRIEGDDTSLDPLQKAGCELKRFNAFVPIWGISERVKREMISVGGNLMSFDLLTSLWREPDVSIIHTHTLGRIGAMGLMIARRRNAPLVVTIHGGVLDLPDKLRANFHHSVRQGWDWGRIFGLLLRSHDLLKNADAIVTCNPKEAALLQAKFPGQEIRVQPHGVALETYQTDHRATAGKLFPELRDRKILLCVGRIDAVKNQGWLIEQAPEIFRKHPQAVLVLAGACTEEKYGKLIERKIAELGLGGRVLLTGGLPPADPRLIGLLQLADAVVLPSVSETFGLVLLEAWAAGAAVIASRTSGAMALIREGENGRLFDLEKPEIFHRAVAEALTNGEARQRLAAVGGELVAVQYNTQVWAGRMKKIYEQLIKEKHALRHSA